MEHGSCQSSECVTGFRATDLVYTDDLAVFRATELDLTRIDRHNKTRLSRAHTRYEFKDHQHDQCEPESILFTLNSRPIVE